MSKIIHREELDPLLVSRVVENAPIRELIRVYSEAVAAAVNGLNNDQVVEALENSGYFDLIQAFVDTDESAESEEVEPQVEQTPEPKKGKKAKG